MKWSSPEHALYVGAVMGLGMRHGLNIRPEVDAEGDYTDRLIVDIGGGWELTLIVPPPPEGWRLDEWIAMT